MAAMILATKLYVPKPLPGAVARARLLERLDEGLRGRLTLISAPAGFGKSVLASQWAAACERPVAWLSLDAGDSDPTRFVAYVIAALQGIAPGAGGGALRALQSPQPPAVESVLTELLNDLAAAGVGGVLVLDDYHAVDAPAVDAALAFLIEHLPPGMQLVIATREDPHLPLARLRAQGQLTEVRAADLRFTPAEAAVFLNDAMGLSLSEQDIEALESRTEGWIAGLQLAAISMRGLDDASGFVASFTGSNRFVLDYLVEEVLQKQPEGVQAFLLKTSILDRLCGSLCDAMLLDPSSSGRETLAYLEHANLFIIPLDVERRWYRYHHLFAELLRQRLEQSAVAVTELHVRASEWLEQQGLDIEAFRHAVDAQDIARAERLIDGKGMPLTFRGGMIPVLNWLSSLPESTLNARPSLWTTYASVTLIAGKTAGVEQMLQTADTLLRELPPDDTVRDCIGRNAAVWATLAANLNDSDAIVSHSRRALEYLHPENLAFRTSTVWKLGFAYYLQREYAAAGRAFVDVIAASEASGNTIFGILALIGLGRTQELSVDLYQADASLRRALQLLGDLPLPVAGDAHFGLARVYYEWNDLEAAGRHGQASMEHARQKDLNDRLVRALLLLAMLRRAEGDLTGATALVAEAERAARQQQLDALLPEIAAVQVRLLLDLGDPAGAAQYVDRYDHPASRARVRLANGDAAAALALLEPLQQQAEARGWVDERLSVLVLRAVAHAAQGEMATAVQALGDALALGEPGGVLRRFLDEGEPLAPVLAEAVARGVHPAYASRLLDALESARHDRVDAERTGPPALDALSARELEVLRLIALGLSNREIADRLYLALNTVKGHNRVIFSKLQVQRRTEAVARARARGLL